MKVFYSQEDLGDARGGIFLAGPTPRDDNAKTWRPEALRLLETFNFNGCVYVPEDRGFPDGCKNIDIREQTNWELDGIRRSDVIAFWVPRELLHMPAFHTNIEFGAAAGFDQRTCAKPYILGFPPEARKMGYMITRATDQSRPIKNTLSDTIQTAVDHVRNLTLS